MDQITIDLVRHGDVAGGKKLLGITDEPLSALGWQQLRTAFPITALPWQKVISSPLQRCSAYAKEIASQLSVPLLLDEQFQELDFGNWDGQLLNDLYASDSSADLMRFMNEPTSLSPPYGESYQAFELRIITAWEVLLESLHQEQIAHCVLVIHGGVIRTILSHILGFPNTNLFRIEVPYACLSRIKQYEQYPPVLSFHGGNI
ncbi:MAG: histidine phosphatase family protein [Piscirickettsiaceae bacterium]|nr:histidine phosphatase family protein [Piscirickettsiaceae bacterium]